jgi:tetraacyldisaccharide 4'-kinase
VWAWAAAGRARRRPRAGAGSAWRWRRPRSASPIPSSSRPLASFAGQQAVALAAIAAPERFFAHAGGDRHRCRPEPWPDHHPFVRAELEHLRRRTVLMTQKDAVKCEAFAAPDWWVVPLDAEIPEEAVGALERDLRRAMASRA